MYFPFLVLKIVGVFGEDHLGLPSHTQTWNLTWGGPDDHGFRGNVDGRALFSSPSTQVSIV